MVYILSLSLWFIFSFFIVIGITLQEVKYSLKLYFPIYHAFVTDFTGSMQETESLSSVPDTESVQQCDFLHCPQPVSEQRKAIPKNWKAWRSTWCLDPALEDSTAQSLTFPPGLMK